MAACVAFMFLLPVNDLIYLLTSLPVLGEIPVIGVILMTAGIAWALININSLPMVVDMTENSRIGTYTGLYYLFSNTGCYFRANIIRTGHPDLWG